MLEDRVKEAIQRSGATDTLVSIHSQILEIGAEVPTKAQVASIQSLFDTLVGQVNGLYERNVDMTTNAGEELSEDIRHYYERFETLKARRSN